MASNLPLAGVSQPYCTDDRDFGHFSDHETVWIDKHIGVENAYPDFKANCDNNIQVLKSNTVLESEIDDDSFLCADPVMIKELRDQVYCLKYFSTIEKGLQYINNASHKKIFFVSSGTLGREVVPKIAGLRQIQGIYIFCGNISAHTEWAADYVNEISAMLEHQDDLLQRLTQDIAVYLEGKGDRYKEEEEFLKTRNCYSWAKKLLIRGQKLGCLGSSRSLERVSAKLDAMQSSTTSVSSP